MRQLTKFKDGQFNQFSQSLHDEVDRHSERVKYGKRDDDGHGGDVMSEAGGMAGGDWNSAEKACDGGCSGHGSESTKTGTLKVTVASTAITLVVNGLRRRKTAAVAGSGNGDSPDQSRRQGYRSTRRRTANSTGQMEVVIGTPVGRNLARKQTAGKLRGGRGRRR